MPENVPPPATGMIDHAAINRAHELATRDALLEHARMGRSVSESRNGKIVTVTPTEGFARYRQDENGQLPARLICANRRGCRIILVTNRDPTEQSP